VPGTGIIEVADGLLGISDVGGEVTREAQVPPPERVGEVGVVLASTAISTACTLEGRCPPGSEELCHP
jgi:hypothetical protein